MKKKSLSEVRIAARRVRAVNHLEEALLNAILRKPGSKVKIQTTAELLVQSLLNQAVAGDQRALASIFDRVLGTAVQRQSVKSENEVVFRLQTPDGEVAQVSLPPYLAARLGTPSAGGDVIDADTSFVPDISGE